MIVDKLFNINYVSFIISNNCNNDSKSYVKDLISNINNDIYKQDIEKSELLSESTILKENASQDESILDEEINEIRKNRICSLINGYINVIFLNNESLLRNC